MATVALQKRARTSGPRKEYNIQPNPDADRLVEFLRSELLDLMRRLDWTYEDLAKKTKKLSKQAAEQSLRKGGFGEMVRNAKAMGVRVIVDLR